MLQVEVSKDDRPAAFCSFLHSSTWVKPPMYLLTELDIKEIIAITHETTGGGGGGGGGGVCVCVVAALVWIKPAKTVQRT